jgi:hypothetical protein
VAQTEQAAHLAWEPEPADLEEVLRVHARLSRWRRTRVLLAAAVLAGGGSATLAGSLAAGIGPLLAIAVVAVLPLHRLAARRAWRRDPHAGRPSTAVLVPGDGLHLTLGDEVTATYRWSVWDAVVETDRLYLLRVATGPPRLLPLPKRGARDAVDAARVRAVLTAELGEPVDATGGRRRRRTAR